MFRPILPMNCIGPRSGKGPRREPDVSPPMATLSLGSRSGHAVEAGEKQRQIELALKQIRYEANLTAVGAWLATAPPASPLSHLPRCFELFGITGKQKFGSQGRVAKFGLGRSRSGCSTRAYRVATINNRGNGSSTEPSCNGG